jgi:hypothetical protein
LGGTSEEFGACSIVAGGLLTDFRSMPDFEDVTILWVLNACFCDPAVGGLLSVISTSDYFSTFCSLLSINWDSSFSLSVQSGSTGLTNFSSF